MQTTIAKQATGVAHGKIILIGEHAAVYHKPAIAIPCTAVKTSVNITSGHRGLYIYCDLFSGYMEEMPELLSSLKSVIHATLDHLNQRSAALHIAIDSSIPIERGMGSSAAVSVAVIKALFKFFNKVPKSAELMSLVSISEKMIHGNPSGLDATIIVNQVPLLFQKNFPMMPISLQTTGYLVIADTGITGQTRQAIDIVSRFKSHYPIEHRAIIDRLDTLTRHVQKELCHGNLKRLGQHFTKSHYLLQQLGVSHPVLNHFVEESLEQGALGAKMTGGGLGGCMFALCNTKKEATVLSNHLLAIGAKQTYSQALTYP